MSRSVFCALFLSLSGCSFELPKEAGGASDADKPKGGAGPVEASPLPVHAGECEAIAIATKGQLAAATAKSPVLLEKNEGSHAAALGAQGIKKRTDAVWLQTTNPANLDVTIKKVADSAATPIPLSNVQKANPGEIFEIATATLRKAGASLNSDAAKFQQFKYFAYLGKFHPTICSGPRALSYIGARRSRSFLGDQGGKAVLVDEHPRLNAVETINTCFVDDGNRCTAEALIEYGFFFTDNLADFGGIVTLAYDEEVVQVNHQIVLQTNPGTR